MTDPNTIRIVAGWLASLCEVTRHGPEGRPSKNSLSTMATMLALDFGSSAFTMNSLRHVAREHEWFPSFSVLRTTIGEWWKENRPAVARLPPPADHTNLAAGLTGMDRVHHAAFTGRVARGCFDPANGHVSYATALSCLRGYSPAAWRAVVGDQGEVIEPLTRRQHDALAARFGSMAAE